MIKKLFTIRSLIVTLVVLAGVSVNSLAFAQSFSDVGSGDWFYSYAQILANDGIIDDSKATFEPYFYVTRDVAAKIVVKAAGYTDAQLTIVDKPSFTDVTKDSWSYPYIETAKEKGFISGLNDGSYAPLKKVNRAEFAAMIMRSFKLQKNIAGSPHFNDVQTSDWFFDAVETVRNSAIVDGYPSGDFKPYEPITRSEMAKMIVKALDLPVTPVSQVKPVEKPVETSKESITGPKVTVDNKPVEIVKSIINNGVTGGTSGGTDYSGGTSNGSTNGNVGGNTGGDTGGNSGGGSSNLFSDDFSAFAIKNYNDGETFEPWSLKFNGFGTVGIETDGNNKYLHLSPQVSDAANKTSSALVTGPNYSGPIAFQAKMITVAQLRTGSTPNPWEVGWMVWNYTDTDHFYYFIPKTNGWELGKRDPGYAGGQRFLATGSDTVFPIGQWYSVKIQQDASNTITVFVNGIKVTTFTDLETPYGSGNIGFYTEDAHIHVDDVSVPVTSVP